MKNIPYAYLNGKFTASSEALISPFDRGFLFGDGVYEAIMVFEGKLQQFEDHLVRLEQSLAAIQIKNPHERSDYRGIAERLIDSSPEKDLMFYLQISRGLDANFPFYRQSQVIPENDFIPSVFGFVCPILIPREIDAYPEVSLQLCPDIRWHRCDIKSNNLLANVLIRTETQSNGAYDGLMVREGYLTESAGNNVFFVKNGILYTPPTSPTLLSGTMRKRLIESAKVLGIPCETQQPLPREFAFEVDEMWSCCTTKDALPVTELMDESGNRTPVGNGKPGPIWRKMIEYLLSHRET